MVRLADRLDMTIAFDWDVKPQNQAKKHRSNQSRWACNRWSCTIVRHWRLNFNSVGFILQYKKSVPLRECPLEWGNILNFHLGALLFDSRYESTFYGSVLCSLLYIKSLTHVSLASFLWGIGKQCRPRSEATKCGI